MIRAATTLAGLPATPPPTISVPNAAPETIVVSIWGGPPGPAGAPGAGVSLQGVADTWPPSDAPAAGDLYVVADPVPAGTPAGIEAGDGVVWSGEEWVSTGPIRGPAGETGPEGPEGPQGHGPSVFEGVDEPLTAIEGDLWLKPETDPDGDTVLVLNVFSGGAWKPVAGGSGASLPIAAADVSCDLRNIVLPSVPLGVIDLQTVLANLEIGFQSYALLYGDVTFSTVQSNTGVFSELYYGAIIAPNGAKASDGYLLPTPTGDGYLRSDIDPDTGWYFAEPVIVSDTAPPAPAGGGALWIDPTGDGVPDTSDGPLSETNPLKYASPLVMSQTDGTPIGLSADGLTFHQPVINGAIPILIDGKRYLLPVIEE